MTKKDEILIKAIMSRVSEEDMDKLYKQYFEKRVVKTILKYSAYKESQAKEKENK